MNKRTFDQLRANRHKDPFEEGEVDKNIFQRIGESADGATLRGYLEQVQRSSSVSLEPNELLEAEARRRFASELLHLMEPRRAKNKPSQ